MCLEIHRDPQAQQVILTAPCFPLEVYSPPPLLFTISAGSQLFSSSRHSFSHSNCPHLPILPPLSHLLSIITSKVLRNRVCNPNSSILFSSSKQVLAGNCGERGREGMILMIAEINHFGLIKQRTLSNRLPVLHLFGIAYHALDSLPQALQLSISCLTSLLLEASVLAAYLSSCLPKFFTLFLPVLG